ncbi:MAG: AI-2E family transporter [Coxiella sp. (in: Bacteria)]|nr:MAG: AI-2E family transporter [Coxiella sp. (in: g-proteobacteria)]
MIRKNPIIVSISQWFQRTFSDPEAISLFMTIVLALVFLELFGTILMPILVSIVLAYLLNSGVVLLERYRCPHMLAVLVMYILFLGILVYGILGLMPLLIRELNNLIHELPTAFSQSQLWFQHMVVKYPKYLSQTQLDSYATTLQQYLADAGQAVLKYLVSLLPNIIHIVLYLVLIPLFVFFFLKDSKAIIHWTSQYMPQKRGLSIKVWQDLNKKIGAYVKGRVLEIFIVSIIASIAFSLLGLNYAVLLGVAFGVSVIIPYVGAIIVTIPIVIVALLQFGWSVHFAYVCGVYALITVLDANLLVPILFSESMDLHPLVIILSVVVFGGIWGFWGIFFAIPLATLIDVILRAWPSQPIPKTTKKKLT